MNGEIPKVADQRDDKTGGCEAEDPSTPDFVRFLFTQGGLVRSLDDGFRA